MKCVICHSSNIEEKAVDEIVWVGKDLVLVRCRALVCNECGERYYSRQTMQRLEDIEARLRARTLALEPVGQVLKPAAQTEPALAVREPRPDYSVERMLKFPVTVQRDEEGWFVAECSTIPGCISQGGTLDEALVNIREAIELCLEVRRDEGLPLTIDTFEVEVPVYA